MAIYKPANSKIMQAVLISCWKLNSDGAGFCYPNEDGKLTLVKGLMTWDEFIKAFIEHDVNSRQALIHFRAATHGKVDADNTHPFLVSDELAIIHNGVIKKLPIVNASFSDSWHFARFMGKLLKTDIGCWYDGQIKEKLEKGILGEHNRVAFLHANGRYELYNKKMWTEFGGAWFSNEGFRCGLVTGLNAEGNIPLPAMPTRRTKHSRANKKRVEIVDDGTMSDLEYVGLHHQLKQKDPYRYTFVAGSEGSTSHFNSSEELEREADRLLENNSIPVDDESDGICDDCGADFTPRKGQANSQRQLCPVCYYKSGIEANEKMRCDSCNSLLDSTCIGIYNATDLYCDDCACQFAKMGLLKKQAST